MKFNEDSRVKIPAILHLMRLGYQYLSLKGQTWDIDTNIFPQLFKAAISKINPGIEGADVGRLLEDVKLLLDNEDLGRAFFERLSDRSNTKLIDFENFNNNSFHVVTELTCQNGDEEFRPDITLLINGMPLVFIEVKKPNNKGGIKAVRAIAEPMGIKGNSIAELIEKVLAFQAAAAKHAPRPAAPRRCASSRGEHPTASPCSTSRRPSSTPRAPSATASISVFRIQNSSALPTSPSS